MGSAGEAGLDSTAVVRIYSDGACKGNPGPGGWGALLKWNDHERELYGGEANTTNNRMELLGVIYTDSQYVQKGISEWIIGWKRRGWKTADKKPVKNAELWRRLDELASTKGHRVTWHWVKGHAGHPENERADELANRGVTDPVGNA